MGGTPPVNDSLPPSIVSSRLRTLRTITWNGWRSGSRRLKAAPPDTCRGRYRSIRGSPVLKTGSGESRSWVRIPLPPPASLQFFGFSHHLREKRRIWPESGTSGPPENCTRWGSDASFGDFSLFALWAVDLACRWTSASPPLIGECTDRLRKSEGSLLRRPVHWNIKTAGL